MRSLVDTLRIATLAGSFGASEAKGTDFRAASLQDYGSPPESHLVALNSRERNDIKNAVVALGKRITAGEAVGIDEIKPFTADKISLNYLRNNLSPQQKTSLVAQSKDQSAAMAAVFEPGVLLEAQEFKMAVNAALKLGKDAVGINTLKTISAAAGRDNRGDVAELVNSGPDEFRLAGKVGLAEAIKTITSNMPAEQAEASRAFIQQLKVRLGLPKIDPTPVVPENKKA